MLFIPKDLLLSRNRIMEESSYGQKVVEWVKAREDKNLPLAGSKDYFFFAIFLLQEMDNPDSKFKDFFKKFNKILKKNRVLLDKLVDILLNQETINKKVFKLTTSKLLKV